MANVANCRLRLVYANANFEPHSGRTICSLIEKLYGVGVALVSFYLASQLAFRIKLNAIVFRSGSRRC